MIYQSLHKQPTKSQQEVPQAMCNTQLLFVGLTNFKEDNQFGTGLDYGLDTFASFETQSKIDKMALDRTFLQQTSEKELPEKFDKLGLLVETFKLEWICGTWITSLNNQELLNPGISERLHESAFVKPSRRVAGSMPVRLCENGVIFHLRYTLKYSSKPTGHLPLRLDFVGLSIFLLMEPWNMVRYNAC